MVNVTISGLPPSTLDIRSYGASTVAADNRVAIQAALDAALATGLPVSIPAGTYLTSPLTYVGPVSPGVGSTLSILGAGRGQSILKTVASTGTLLTLSGPLRSCRFRDFTIDGTGGTGHGLYYADTAGPNYLYESALENLEVVNCALNGIYVKSSFANRYVNISVSNNAQDQMKVWGGPGDYYERIDVGSTNSGYAGIHALSGGTFAGCNGIYDTAHAAGPMFKFGGDGTGDSDSRTTYPSVHLLGGNVESFTTTGVLFTNSAITPPILQRLSFTAATAANCMAINMLVSHINVPLMLLNCQFALTGGATWKNALPVHCDCPVISEGLLSTDYLSHWAEVDGISYPITARVLGADNPNDATYGFKLNQMTGLTDIAYMASMGLGNVNLGSGFVHRTAAPAMPASGSYTRGDIVDNCSNTVSELGAGGSKYTLTGWRRLTTGSNHVLNTDWVERHELTGN